MTLPPFSRRALLGVALLGPLAGPVAAARPDPILSAIKDAEAADLAFYASGLVPHEGLDADALADRRSHRRALYRARSSARMALHVLTPETRVGALALVAFYERRAVRTGCHGAAKAGRRRLREVFARPGALPGLTHHPPG